MKWQTQHTMSSYFILKKRKETKTIIETLIVSREYEDNNLQVLIQLT